MGKYILFIRDEGVDFLKMPKSELQGVIKNFSNWTKQLGASGKLVAGEKLTWDRGKSLKLKNDKVIVDGPYADTKEAISGFYMIKAKNLNDALETAKECPGLAYGCSLEVREVEA